MDNQTAIIIGSLFGLAITLWILYEIIQSASRGKKIYLEQLKQTKLLTEMARKSGVADETVKEILDESKYENV